MSYSQLHVEIWIFYTNLFAIEIVCAFHLLMTYYSSKLVSELFVLIIQR